VHLRRAAAVANAAAALASANADADATKISGGGDGNGNGNYDGGNGGGGGGGGSGHLLRSWGLANDTLRRMSASLSKDGIAAAQNGGNNNNDNNNNNYNNGSGGGGGRGVGGGFRLGLDREILANPPLSFNVSIDAVDARLLVRLATNCFFCFLFVLFGVVILRFYSMYLSMPSTFGCW
jgi:hypothetical protein